MKKYGFIYIWFDRKHHRFYIGSHWGREDDGYVCSSRWMRKAYRRRPHDFKRRILERIGTDRKALYESEERWLQMIKDHEIRTRYYNMTRTTKMHIHGDPVKAKSTYQKISDHHKNDPNWGHWSIGKVMAEETKQKLKEAHARQFQDPQQIELRRQKAQEQWADPAYREARSKEKLGHKQSSETIAKRIQTFRDQCIHTGPRKGERKHTSEALAKMRTHSTGLKWWNNGTINKRSKTPIEGFTPGRLQPGE